MAVDSTPVATVRIIQRWESFWFEGIPPELYALLRIVFGALCLANLAGETPISMFWPLDGLLPIVEAGGVKAELVRLGLGTLAGRALFAGLLVSFGAMTL